MYVCGLVPRPSHVPLCNIEIQNVGWPGNEAICMYMCMYEEMRYPHVYHACANVTVKIVTMLMHK